MLRVLKGDIYDSAQQYPGESEEELPGWLVG
jgi:hypothetical protein